MSLMQALQVLGLGEGRRSASGDGPTPPPSAAVAPPRPSNKFGRHAVTAHERAQMARLPGPKPAPGLDGEMPPEYAMAMNGMEGAPTGGAAFSGEPPMSIRSAARPVVLLSQYRPPSGGAVNPQTGEKC